MTKYYYNPRLYTLVIETYDSDFNESTNYVVKKFASRSDLASYVDTDIMDCLENWFEQQIGSNRLVKHDSIYRVYHEID